MKVLIADDNPMWTKLLAKTVERYDFDAITVDNGRDAMRELESNDPPRIVFLDWQMPIIDGLEACRRIKDCQRDRSRSNPGSISISGASIPRSIKPNIASSV